MFGRDIVTVLTGMGILIGIYLFLAHGNTTISIIDKIATNTVSGVKTLQGRG
jgi:hypothetical protein